MGLNNFKGTGITDGKKAIPSKIGGKRPIVWNTSLLWRSFYVGGIQWQISAEWSDIGQWSQWRAYKKTPLLTPYDLTFPQNWASQLHTQDQLRDACCHLAKTTIIYRQAAECCGRCHYEPRDVAFCQITLVLHQLPIWQIGLRLKSISRKSQISVQKRNKNYSYGALSTTSHGELTRISQLSLLPSVGR